MHDVNEIAKPLVEDESSAKPYKGQITGSLEVVLDNSGEMVASRYYYDYLKRMVQSKSTTHIGGLVISDIEYDFLGNVLTNRETNHVPGVDEPDVLYRYTSVPLK